MKPELNRLKIVIDTQFGGLANFCKIINEKPDNLRSYFTKNSTPGKKWREKFSQFGINLIWLDHGIGEMLTSSENIQSNYVLEMKDGLEIMHDLVEIPTIESAFPCGTPETNTGDIFKVPVPRVLVNNIKNPYLLKCKGNSMMPIIKDGDYVVTDTIDGDVSKIKNGDIVVAYINSEYTVKRYFKKNGSYILSPENQSEFEPYVLKQGDEMQIIGIVKKLLTDIN